MSVTVSPDDLYDSGGEGQTEHDVDGAEEHVHGAVCTSFFKLLIIITIRKHYSKFMLYIIRLKSL